MDVKKIIGATIGLAVTGYGLFKLTKGGEPPKYSNKWFKTVSDTVLKEERENVRKQFCSAGNDFDLAVRLQKLLNYFDKVIGERAWNGSTDYKFPVHSEHGWHLPSDD